MRRTARTATAFQAAAPIHAAATAGGMHQGNTGSVRNTATTDCHADAGHAAFVPTEGGTATDTLRNRPTCSSATGHLNDTHTVDETRRWATLALVMGLTLGVLTVSGTATGQERGAPVPDRIGPEWNWHQHEPTQDATRSREGVDGVAPSPQEARREAYEVDQLYRELTGQSPTALPQVSASPASASTARRHQDVVPR